MRRVHNELFAHVHLEPSSVFDGVKKRSTSSYPMLFRQEAIIRRQDDSQDCNQIHLTLSACVLPNRHGPNRCALDSPGSVLVNWNRASESAHYQSRLGYSITTAHTHPNGLPVLHGRTARGNHISFRWVHGVFRAHLLSDEWRRHRKRSRTKVSGSMP